MDNKEYEDAEDNSEIVNPDDLQTELVVEDDEAERQRVLAEEMAEGDDPLLNEEEEAARRQIEDEMNEVIQNDDSMQGFFEHTDAVYDVAINPTNPDLIVTGGGDDKAYLWNASNGETFKELPGHTDSVIGVAFSKNGQYVATGGMDGKVLVWEALTGAPVVSLEGPGADILWIDWHPKGTVLLAGAADATVWMWLVPQGTCMQVFGGHSDAVGCGQFSPDGKLVVTGSDDCTLRVWNPKTGECTVTYQPGHQWHTNALTSLAVHHENAVFMSASVDQMAVVGRLDEKKVLGNLGGHTGSIESVGFCDVLPLGVTGCMDGSIRIWDMTQMNLRTTCQHEDGVVKAQFIPGTPMIVSCSTDRTVRIWDGRSGQQAKILKGHQDTVLGFDILGDRLVTCSDDKASLVFSLSQ